MSRPGTMHRSSDVLHASSRVIENLEQAGRLANTLADKAVPSAARLASRLSDGADTITTALAAHPLLPPRLASSSDHQDDEKAKQAVLTVANDVGLDVIKYLHHALSLSSPNPAGRTLSQSFEPAIVEVAIDAAVTDTVLSLEWLRQTREARLAGSGSGSNTGAGPLPELPESVAARLSRYNGDSAPAFAQYLAVPISAKGRKQIETSASGPVVCPVAQSPKLTKTIQGSGRQTARSSSQQNRRSIFGLFRRSVSSSPSAPLSVSSAAANRHSVALSGGQKTPTLTPPAMTATSSSSLSSARSSRTDPAMASTTAASPATSMSSVSLNEDGSDSPPKLSATQPPDSPDRPSLNVEIPDVNLHFHDALSAPPTAAGNRKSTSPTSLSPSTSPSTSPKSKKAWAEARSIRQAQLLMRTQSDDGATALSVRMADRSRSVTPTWRAATVPSVLVSSPLASSDGSPPKSVRETISQSRMGSGPSRRSPLSSKGRLCTGALTAQSASLLRAGTVIAIPPSKPQNLTVPAAAPTSRPQSMSTESSVPSRWKSLLRRSSRPRSAKSKATTPPPTTDEAAWKCNTCPCTIPLGLAAPPSVISGQPDPIELGKTINASLGKVEQSVLPLLNTDPVAAAVLGNRVDIAWRLSFLIKSHAAYLQTTSETGDGDQAAPSGPFVCIFCSNSDILAGSVGSQAHQLMGHRTSSAISLPASAGTSVSGSMPRAMSAASTSAIPASTAPAGATLSASSSSQSLSLGRQMHLHRIQQRQSTSASGYGMMTMKKKNRSSARIRSSFPIYHTPAPLLEHIVTTHAYDAQLDHGVRALLGSVAFHTNCSVVVGQKATERHGAWDLNIVW